MRTTIDLPDPILRKAKVAAASKGISLKTLFTRALSNELGDQEASGDKQAKRAKLPLIRSAKPNQPIVVTNDMLDKALNEDA